MRGVRWRTLFPDRGGKRRRRVPASVQICAVSDEPVGLHSN